MLIPMSHHERIKKASPAFLRALRECERWGVVVIVVGVQCIHQRSTSDYFMGPDHEVCIDADNGVIFWADEDLSPYAAAGLIHEMTHVIVWRELGVQPEMVDDELELMLAIDREACRRIRADWIKWMGKFQVSDEYGLSSATDWERSSTWHRHRLLRKALGNARKARLMKDGKPTYRWKYDIVKGKGQRHMTEADAAA